MENYEQKYKEALSWAHSAIKAGADGMLKEDLERVFPELKEPEDERIRKGLIKGLSAMRDIHKHQTFSDDAINIDDAIAWLEKQGEQKPAEKTTWYDNMDDLIADAMIDDIKNADMPEHCKHNRLTWINKHRGKPAVWSEEDEKMLSSIIEEVYPYGECPDYPTEEEREYYYTHQNMVD